MQDERSAACPSARRLPVDDLFSTGHVLACDDLCARDDECRVGLFLADERDVRAADHAERTGGRAGVSHFTDYRE